jgi:hypothetical protein
MQFTRQYEIDETTFEVTFSISNVKVEDAGIGAYEFWGQRGIDSEMGVTDFDISIESVKLDYSDHELRLTELEKSSLYPKIEDKISDDNELFALIFQMWNEPPEE